MTKQQFNIDKHTTPIDDISDLIDQNIKTISEQNTAEQKNINSAKKKHYYKNFKNIHNWFNLETFQEIHKDMFGNVWKWAGELRNINIVIGNNTSIASKMYEIRQDLKCLLDDFAIWQKKFTMTPLEQAARIYHRLIKIHPFKNGNGRFSLFILELYTRNYYLPIILPDLHIKSEWRTENVNALKEADRGNYEPLIDFLYKVGIRDIPLSKLFAANNFKKAFPINKIDAYVKAITNPNYKYYDINETENNGHSALNITIKYSYEKHAILLIKRGADIKKDRSRLNALETAISSEKYQVAKIIKKKHPKLKISFIRAINTGLSNKIYKFNRKFET